LISALDGGGFFFNGKRMFSVMWLSPILDDVRMHTIRER
jgi:hypothetical protein